MPFHTWLSECLWILKFGIIEDVTSPSLRAIQASKVLRISSGRRALEGFWTVHKLKFNNPLLPTPESDGMNTENHITDHYFTVVMTPGFLLHITEFLV